MWWQGELGERHSLASESGSSTDSHADALENKDGERPRAAYRSSSNLVALCDISPNSEEKIRRRFDVQQLEEHRKKEKPLAREPWEMHWDLRWGKRTFFFCVSQSSSTSGSFVWIVFVQAEKLYMQMQCKTEWKWV